MQIIQSPLGNNIHPLGIRSSLSNPDKMLLRKESHSLQSRSNFISSIQTKPPLVTSSKFFLSSEHEASIEPLIGWDTQDISSELPLLEVDSFDLITPQENSSESITTSIPEIMPTRIDNNLSNDTASEINLSGKSKSKSKKTNKSQQPPEKKSTTKSKTKKSVKSSAAKLIDESNIHINYNENSLLASDESLLIEANLELPTLQLDIASDNLKNDDSISVTTPSRTTSILPSLEDKSTLFRNITKDELQANPELPSSLPSAESSVRESISQLQQRNELSDNTSELAEASVVEFPLHHNADQTFISDNSLGNNEQEIIPEALELVNILEIPLSQTLPQQDVETDKLPSISNNQTTVFPKNFIQRKEVLPTLNSPSSKEESPNINSNFEAITAIESDLILENNTNDFVTDNPVADNSLENVALSSTLTSFDVDGTLHSLANDQNIIGADSFAPKADVAVPNSDSSVALLSAFTSPNVDQAPTLLHPLANDENIVGVDSFALKADVPNSESSVALSSAFISTNVDQATTLVHPLANDENIIGADSFTPKADVAVPNSDSSVALSSAFTSPNVDQAPTLLHPLVNDENIVGVDSLAPKADVPNSDSSVGLSSAFTSPNVDQAPILLHPLANDENIIGADSLAPKADVPNSDSSVGLSSAFTSPNVDQAPTLLHPLANDQNIIGVDSFAPKADVAVPNSDYSVVKSPVTVQQEIDSNVTSESPVSAPVQLTPTSADIEDTLSLFRNSDSNEQLATSESQSAMAVNVSNVSANVTSLEHDTNIENTTSEFIESHPILALPEIDEVPVVTAISPKIAEASRITAIPPEIAEVPKITATPPEIAEASRITATPPEIAEAPVSAISPEIAETAMFNEKPLGIYTPPIPATSPEIIETENIFRKIIDNEQPVESEFPFAVTNPEISTLVDTSDNRDIPEEATSPQNEVGTPPKVEQKQNAIAENLPAPKGYATGGHVIDSHVENRYQIAASDTVPAMLTPGEFVINTRDAQKNLPLLHHINTGGTPHELILPSLQTPNAQEPEEITSPETPTKVDSFPDTSLQLKSAETPSSDVSNSLIPPALGLDIGKQKLSILNSPQLNPLQNETIHVDEPSPPSPQYSSPPLIFRKANPSTNTSSQWSNTPSQWSSVEDLLNGNNDEFPSFNFSDVESNSQNYESSQVSESPQVFAKHLPSPRGFADGGEVTLPDISRKIEPITETIESVSSSSQEDDKDDMADLEALAREIYNRLRQRIEIERERHGGHSGRLPW
ncbi:hypothetical protein [uncultured Nostoc sp.]|uniref:hypothetical protein n=1 Tax=uncultured Nostoc sp. TaxID=340711 RepID=UPI0035C9BDB7